MTEMILVFIIVAIAAVLIGYKFYKTLSGKGGCCSCGKKADAPCCNGCSVKH